MNYIKRYVAAVGERLPSGQQTDIENELESLIQDALEDRTGQKDGFADEDILAVLREMGPPQETAQRYAPRPRYLIGPAYFKTYQTALITFGSIIGLIVLIATVLELLSGGESLWNGMGLLFSRLLSGGVQVLGWTTLIFAIVERLQRPFETEDETPGSDEADWDPADLPPLPKEAKIGLGSTLFEIFLSLFAILGVFFFARQLGLYGGAAQDFAVVFRADTIQTFFPWWTAVWGLGLLNGLIRLRRRHWNAFFRLREIGVNLLSLVLIGFLIASPILIPENFSMLADTEAEALATAGSVAAQALNGAWIVVMLFILWDSLEHGWALLKGKRTANET